MTLQLDQIAAVLTQVERLPLRVEGHAEDLPTQGGGQDALVVDLICLGFEIEPWNDRWLMVNEEMLGYKELLTQLAHVFPTMRREDDWWSSVAFPPFGRCFTELYRKPTRSW